MKFLATPLLAASTHQHKRSKEHLPTLTHEYTQHFKARKNIQKEAWT